MFWCDDTRDVLSVTGADASTYLQSQLSQDLRSLAIGASTYSFALDPSGKVVALLRVVRTGDSSFLLDTDAGHGELLAARLNRFRIRVDVTIESLDWQCIAVRGVGSELLPVIAAPDDGVAVQAWWGDGSAVDLLGPEPRAPEGIAPGTSSDLEAARIDAGWPAASAEIVAGETVPASLGDVVRTAVSFTKGCYPGQELVERMDSRGAVAPTVMRRVEVPTGTSVGDPVTVDGEVVGRVTSVVGTHALALVRRGT